MTKNQVNNPASSAVVIGIASTVIVLGLGVFAYTSFANKSTNSSSSSKSIVSNSSEAMMAKDSIGTIVTKNPNFSTLLAALTAADLVSTIESGTFTVFAPTNEAFAKLPKKVLDNLLKPENKKLLQSVLTYHVVTGTVLASDLKAGPVKTVEGNEVKVTLSPKVIINESNVTSTDIKAKNGVVHVIDTVLLPPSVKINTIVDTAISNGSFTTLVTALKAADLVSTLQGPGPFTVLAPTDAAFAKLPAATLTDLLKPENKEKLKSILLYHVVTGAEVKSTELTDKQVITTANGKNITVALHSGVSFAFPTGSANVTIADIVTDNGIIHAIDTVLLP
jgi:transforming growth factor-beta-induced protein